MAAMRKNHRDRMRLAVVSAVVAVMFLAAGVEGSASRWRRKPAASSLLIRQKKGVEMPEQQQQQVKEKQQAKELAEDSNLIVSLPGAPPVPFSMLSGYITVDKAAGRALFFWFVEAEVADPSSAPLTLWLNGGPGCSSIGGGMLSELGPFYPTLDGVHLIRNPYSWNKVSNMLFVESPAGVGFSYSNTTSDYKTGDNQTAQDTYAFLLGFFEQYPQYSSHKFYVSGESYAGHYVPQLAAAILEGNKVATNKINLIGMAVGNAWTDAGVDNFGAVFFWWSHALLSDATFHGIVKNCNLSALPDLVVDSNPHGVLRNCNFSDVGPLKSYKADVCDKFLDAADYELGNINIYEIYADVCVSAHAQAETRHFAKQLSRTRHGGLSTRPLLKDSDDPCVDDEVEIYLNRPEVQKALHANTTNLPWRWTDCSDIVDYSVEDLLSSVLPLYHTLLESGIEILVFSGDIDAIVPVTGTRAWLNLLPLNITETWRPWIVDNQVGGYVTGYDKLKFTTVRGAGHMVPYTQPARALHLFESFIYNKTF